MTGAAGWSSPVVPRSPAVLKKRREKREERAGKERRERAGAQPPHIAWAVANAGVLNSEPTDPLFNTILYKAMAGPKFQPKGKYSFTKLGLPLVVVCVGGAYMLSHVSCVWLLLPDLLFLSICFYFSFLELEMKSVTAEKFSGP